MSPEFITIQSASVCYTYFKNWKNLKCIMYSGKNQLAYLTSSFKFHAILYNHKINRIYLSKQIDK